MDLPAQNETVSTTFIGGLWALEKLLTWDILLGNFFKIFLFNVKSEENDKADDNRSSTIGLSGKVSIYT